MVQKTDLIDLTGKRLFIFDWDGTLADSIDLITSCLVDSFKELEFGELTEEKAKSIIGLGLIDALELLTPGHSKQDRELLLVTYKKYFFERSSRGVTLFPGVDTMLAFLQNRGVKTAVATGKSRAGLERDLSNSNVRQLINTTRTIDECNPKPDPHMIEEIMKELGFARNETIMIGDTTFDLEMAENAGVESFAITNGAHSIEKLQSAKPLEFFPDFGTFSHYLTNARIGVP